MKEENVLTLIDLLEEQPCLWHIYGNDYTKREKRDNAYKKFAKSRKRGKRKKTKIKNFTCTTWT